MSEERKQHQPEEENIQEEEQAKAESREKKKGSSRSKDKKREKLERRIEELEEQNKELQEKCDRALADYHNLEERKKEEKKEFVKYSNEKLLEELLPVFDNLKISLHHVSEEERENAWVKGVEYVIKQFREVLENNGVEEIEVEGKEFDHETMEAVEGEGTQVKKEVKPGYKLNGKVMIPAKVVVEKEDKEVEKEENEGIEKEEN